MQYLLRKSYSRAQLETHLDKVWDQLAVEPLYIDELDKLGVSAKELTSVPRSQVFQIDPATSRFEIPPEGIPILVLIATKGIELGANIAEDVWEKLLLPILERRLGHGILVKQDDAADASQLPDENKDPGQSENTTN